MTENNSRSCIRALSYNAAVLANSAGDLNRVRNYYQQFLASNPDDPSALYDFARVSLGPSWQNPLPQDAAK